MPLYHPEVILSNVACRMPKVYCDHNFIIAAHDESGAYKAALRESVSHGLSLVLSPWHWLEMARDRDKARGLSVASFSDSLTPLWLLDRVSLHARELAIAFFLKTGYADVINPPIGTLHDVVADLTHDYRAHLHGSPDFVHHLQTLGPDHVLERSLRNNFNAQQRNASDYWSGKIKDWDLPGMDRIYALRLIERLSELSHIVGQLRQEFLAAYKTALCPSILIEHTITYDSWRRKRALTDRNFRDMQHTMALPYVDCFVTDDGALTAIVRRLAHQFPFRIAEIINRSVFDRRYL